MASQDPTAKELRQRLDDLLTTAEKTFANPDEPEFPSELLEIPNLILQLLPYSERKAFPRIPFWRCIKSLDQDKGWLQIPERLGKLVENASRLPQGPFVRLVTDYRNGKLPAAIKPLLVELDFYVYRAEEDLDGKTIPPADRWSALPEDLTRFIPLLSRTLSPTFTELIGQHDPAACSKDAKAWAYTAFSDLVRQVHDWNKRYFKSVSLFCKLLTELHNPEYDEVGTRLAYAPGKGVADFVEQYKKDKDADRKRQARSQAGAKLRHSTDARDDEDKRRKYLRGTLVQKKRPKQ